MFLLCDRLSFRRPPRRKVVGILQAYLANYKIFTAERNAKCACKMCEGLHTGQREMVIYFVETKSSLTSTSSSFAMFLKTRILGWELLYNNWLQQHNFCQFAPRAKSVSDLVKTCALKKKIETESATQLANFFLRIILVSLY